MSDQSTDSAAGAAGGFRSFWKKGSEEASQDVTFVQQDPQKKQRGRIARIFKHSGASSTSESGQSGESSLSDAQKRRQQVYQAQKRHRDRKVEYVKNLEQEVARLQHLDALMNREKTALAHQNQAIREFLTSQSIDVQLDSIRLDDPSTNSEDLGAFGAALDIRFDPDVGHDRVFMDIDDGFAAATVPSAASSSSVTTPGAADPFVRQHTPVKGDSWAALDFILALEWPCKDHVHHPHIHPAPQPTISSDDFTGHALTTTAAVFQSALPPSHAIPEHIPPSAPPGPGLEPTAAEAAAGEKWQLPHSEIDKYGAPASGGPPPDWTKPAMTMMMTKQKLKMIPDQRRRLVELSEKLALDDEQMTPAQAYAAIRRSVPTDARLRPTLDAMKTPLGSLVHCTGIGAILPADSFWQQLDLALQTV